MRALAASEPIPDLRLRPGRPADVDGLLDLESRVFATDRLSRRSFRRFLASPTAALFIAEREGRLAGYGLVLFRADNSAARLYSLAVAPELEGRGVGSILIAAAEEAARTRGCSRLRLEVHEGNARAIARYRNCGYELFGRHLGYYDDRGNALRFEKWLSPHHAGYAGGVPRQSR